MVYFRLVSMIRPYKASDIEGIIDIWLEASFKSHDFIDRDYWTSMVDDMRSIYLPGSETYVFEIENKIVGFLSLVGNNLEAIFVKPEYQGRGIGKELILKAKELRSRLKLKVYKRNEMVMGFYEKAGFHTVSEQIDPGTDQPELIMEWSRSS